MPNGLLRIVDAFVDSYVNYIDMWKRMILDLLEELDPLYREHIYRSFFQIESDRQMTLSVCFLPALYYPFAIRYDLICDLVYEYFFTAKKGKQQEQLLLPAPLKTLDVEVENSRCFYCKSISAFYMCESCFQEFASWSPLYVITDYWYREHFKFRVGKVYDFNFYYDQYDDGTTVNVYVEYSGSFFVTLQVEDIFWRIDNSAFSYNAFAIETQTIHGDDLLFSPRRFEFDGFKEIKTYHSNYKAMRLRFYFWNAEMYMSFNVKSLSSN
jgi:hypothetical protein